MAATTRQGAAAVGAENNHILPAVSSAFCQIIRSFYQILWLFPRIPSSSLCLYVVADESRCVGALLAKEPLSYSEVLRSKEPFQGPPSYTYTYTFIRA